MNSRAVLTVLLGIFWFLYPPKAYAAECKQCKALQQLAQNEKTDIKDWDTDKTTWNKTKSPSDQPIKVKKSKAQQTNSK